MSWRASAWAFDQVTGIGANAKLVLLALCEFANDENKTWRGQAEIAKRAECELRTVRSHLKSLEEWGLIERKPLYRWCDSDSEKCSSRPAHKHRSGTVYRINLEVGEFDYANKNNSTQLVDNSTSAKFASVEKSAECSGKVHRCKICICEKGASSTGANSCSPQVQELATICNSKPPIKPPTNQGKFDPSPGNVESVGGVDGETKVSSVSDAALSGQASLTEDDLELFARCIPRGRMRNVLAGKAGVRVAKALRRAIDSGWQASEILWRLDNNPAPDSPRNLAGLMIHRVEEIAQSPPPSAPTGSAQGSHSTTGTGQKVDPLLAAQRKEILARVALEKAQAELEAEKQAQRRRSERREGGGKKIA